MTIDVVAAAIIDGERVLAALRGPQMKTPNRWEFPGGKVEPGESHASALAREIREELGADIDVGERLGEAIVEPIRLVLYRATLRRGPLQPTEHAAVAWVRPSAFSRLHWADADVPLLDAVRDTLRP